MIGLSLTGIKAKLQKSKQTKKNGLSKHTFILINHLYTFVAQLCDKKILIREKLWLEILVTLKGNMWVICGRGKL